MPRPVDYHETFRRDLAAHVNGLRRHRPPQDRLRLRAALAAFTQRVAAHPALGNEIERNGIASYRVFHLGPALPYLIWYVYDVSDARAAVRLMMFRNTATPAGSLRPAGSDASSEP